MTCLGRWIVFFALLAPFLDAAESEVGALQKKAGEIRFEVGKKAPFLGVFAAIEAEMTLKEKLRAVREIVERNPFITGVTLRVQWRQFHPDSNTVDFDGLDALVGAAGAAGKLVNIALLPGAASPEWIYEFGVKKLGPVRVGGNILTTPVPWDYRYLEIYWGDLRRLQAKYGTDPRVWAITVLGQNYSDVSEGMHAPANAELAALGWTKHSFLENWKIWVDLYDEMFPTKKLILVVSENSPGQDALSEGAARYFVEKCQGRAILVSHQMDARNGALPFAAEVCRQLSALAPSGHELAASAVAPPAVPRTIFNSVRTGNLIFFQLPSAAAMDPGQTKSILGAWNRYGWMPEQSLKLVLEEERK